MNIHVKGNIVLDGIECRHCKNKVLGSVLESIGVCDNCGARYELLNTNLSNQKVTVEFKFEGFNCLEISFFSKCNNICPAPFMYCRSHSDDVSIKRAEGTVESAKKTVEKEKDKLNMIKESKKTWMVTKLSGIEDE